MRKSNEAPQHLFIHETWLNFSSQITSPNEMPLSLCQTVTRFSFSVRGDKKKQREHRSCSCSALSARRLHQIKRRKVERVSMDSAAVIPE